MSDFSRANSEMKLQRVPKWLCNRGTGRMHRLHYICRQNLESVYRPVSHYLCGAREGPFSRGSPHTVHGIKKLSSTGTGTDTDTGTDTGAIDNM